MIVSRQHPPIVMEEVTDPEELAKAQYRNEMFERNWGWFLDHMDEVYSQRGKCVCISGQQLFVAETPEKVLEMAAAVFPSDEGRFTRYIPQERMARIYANKRKMGQMF